MTWRSGHSATTLALRGRRRSHRARTRSTLSCARSTTNRSHAMKNQLSSFPADALPWYRERWPWLLFSGPFVVVIASLASAWLAVRSDDGVVARDYYKRGLLINRTLQSSREQP